MLYVTIHILLGEVVTYPQSWRVSLVEQTAVEPTHQQTDMDDSANEDVRLVSAQSLRVRALSTRGCIDSHSLCAQVIGRAEVAELARSLVRWTLTTEVSIRAASLRVSCCYVCVVFPGSSDRGGCTGDIKSE